MGCIGVGVSIPGASFRLENHRPQADGHEPALGPEVAVGVRVLDADQPIGPFQAVIAGHPQTVEAYGHEAAVAVR